VVDTQNLVLLQDLLLPVVVGGCAVFLLARKHVVFFALFVWRAEFPLFVHLGRAVRLTFLANRS